MSTTLSKLYHQDCKFVNSLATQLITLITNCGYIKPVQGNGKVLSGSELEYATDALATDVYTLTLEGYIQYIYYQAYQSLYPLVITPEERVKIYAIYDALQIPRPIL